MPHKKYRKTRYKESQVYLTPIFSCSVGPLPPSNVEEDLHTKTRIFPEVWTPSIDIIEELNKEK